MKYVYPARITPDSKLEGVLFVEFPDIETAVTQGHGLYDALYMAEDVLNLELTSKEDDGDEIPAPTPLDKVDVPKDGFVTLIKADTDEYRKLIAKLNAKSDVA